MSRLIVIADTDTAPGFRLGGAATMSPEPDSTTNPALRVGSQAAPDADQSPAPASEHAAAVVALVEEAAGSDAAVVAVHHRLWSRVPAATRSAWERRTDTLVVALPADDGATVVDRNAALRELLARAVGYEISFSPEADRP